MKALKLSYPVAGSANETYEARLYALRIRACLTTKDFADKIGAKVTKAGALNVSSVSCAEIAKACGVSPIWLYAGSVAPKRFWPEWWTPADYQPDEKQELAVDNEEGETAPGAG